METFSSPVIQNPKNKWKIVGIIFIVLTGLLLIGGGFLGWKFFDQKNQIEALSTEKDKISQERDELTKKISDEADELSAEESAEVLTGKPSAETLLKAMGNPAHVTTADISVGEIHNSSIEPYQAITADIKSTGEVAFQAIFYRANNHSAWTHWDSASDQCTVASGNDILIRAVADFNCYVEANTMSADGPTTYKTYFNL